MRDVVGDIAEKRAIPRHILRHKAHRAIRAFVRQIALAARQVAIVLELRVEIVPPVPRAKSKKFVEPPRIGVVGMLRAIVPFAKGPGGIARGPKHLGHRLLVKVQPLGPCAHAMHAAAQVIASGQKFCPRGRAHRAHVKPVEQRAVSRQRIHIGRIEIRIAVHAQIAPSLIVCQNHENIGFGHGASFLIASYSGFTHFSGQRFSTQRKPISDSGYWPLSSVCAIHRVKISRCCCKASA